MSFGVIKKFEDAVAKFYGSQYAVAVDSCTHSIELCLRYNKVKKIVVPKRTYLSIAFLASKIGIDLEWKDENWVDYYYLDGTNIIDAAVLWERNSYIPETLMCLSFQYQKHLSLGRGGMILTDDNRAYDELKRLSYDGRKPDIKWRRDSEDSTKMSNYQKKILFHVSKFIKNDGVIVYSTCSIENQENWNVVESFLKLNSNFKLESIDSLVPKEWINKKNCLETFPPRDKVDGMFAVKMKKC